MRINLNLLSLCAGVASLALGQSTTAPNYSMTIVAGETTPDGLGDNNPSTYAVVAAPSGIVADSSGNIYIADNTNGRVRKIDAHTGMISSFATVSGPNGMAFDSKGNLFVASGGSHIVNRYDSKGNATLIAGESGNGRYGGDLQHATDALLNAPGGVAVDNAGNVYIADTSNNRIRMVKNTNNCVYDAPTACIIYTIAGPGGTAAASAGAPVFSATANVTQTNVGTDTVGDGGPAVLARVNGPFGIAVTPDGSTVYFSDTGDNRIRAINMSKGTISTLLGTCLDANPSGTPTFNQTTSNNRPVPVACPSGSFGTATGGSGNTFTLYDGKVGTLATANAPRGLYLDSVHQKLYFADSGNNRIRVIALDTGIVTSVVGGGSKANDGALLTALSLDNPYAVYFDSTSGLLYFTERGSDRVRVADMSRAVTKTLVGLPRSTGNDGPATMANLAFPTSISTTSSPRLAVDSQGNLYITEPSANVVRKVTTDGVIHAWAGADNSGFTGDGGPATAARLNNPQCVTFDGAGNAYIADTGNNRIRKVDTDGNISTVAGKGNQTTSCSASASAAGTCKIDKSKYSGDGGPALSAVLQGPQCVAANAAGDLFIADSGNNAIRKVDVNTGIITTIAGGIPAGIPGGPTDGRSGLGTSGNVGDGGDARYALFNNPRGIAIDSDGNIYIADYANPDVRELVPNHKGGYLATTILGAPSSSNNDGITIPTGTGAPSNPIRTRIGSAGVTSVAVDLSGNIYMTDTGNSKILFEDAAHTKLYEIAGGGSNNTGTTYDSSNKFNLQIHNPTGVAVDSNGNVYAAGRTGVVRKLTPPSSK